MIDRAVPGQQLGRAVARVVRVREPEIDQERVGVLRRLPLLEVVHDAVAVPGAAGLGRAATPGGVLPDPEELVRGLVAVAHLAGAHRVVTGAIEDGRDRILLEARRDSPFAMAPGAIGRCQTVRPLMIMCRDGVQTAPTNAPM